VPWAIAVRIAAVERVGGFRLRPLWALRMERYEFASRRRTQARTVGFFAV